MTIKKTALVFIGLMSISGFAFSGFFDDLGDLGQGLIDNIRGKESKDNKKLDDAIQKPIDAVRKPVEKADEKISDAWNEWREDKVDPIGDYISTAYKYLKAGHKGNPNGFPTQNKREMPSPDINVTLNKELLQKMLQQFISEQMPLDKDDPNNGDYIYFDEASFETDSARRVMVAKIARGRLKFNFVTRNTLKIEGGTVEFLPKIRVDNGKTFLDLHARMVYLNVDDVLPMVERGIAHGINDFMKSKDASNGFMSVDLSDAFGASVTIPTVTKKSINTSLSDATIFVEGSNIIYQAKIDASKSAI